MNLADDAILLLLIFAANSAPILASHLIPGRCAAALDGNRQWRDGHAIFGASKTWRGLISGIALPTLLAILVGWRPEHGLLIGALAMIGDLCSSFVKRRLTMPAEARATGLDQIPESLFPTLAATTFLALSWKEVIVIPLAFMIIEIAVSPVLFRLKLRRKPY